MLRLQIGHESFRFTSNSPHEEQVHKWWHGARIQALCLSIQMTHSAFNIQHSGLLAEKKKNQVIIFFIFFFGFFYDFLDQVPEASSWIGAKFPLWAK